MDCREHCEGQERRELGDRGEGVPLAAWSRPVGVLAFAFVQLALSGEFDAGFDNHLEHWEWLCSLVEVSFLWKPRRTEGGPGREHAKE
ncbi:hypothetical protein SAMN05421803_1464 [Nocardiopsis flavescens]|uniref:Uncharacterized protein n=1 Tax=Nocardiopsis flavescens TaxID=758803 RepID=A0A1M6WL01_9ACTN|nr:hypothetical protein [Nocardiopsis flavescens]SHK94398.1 hypothetical protein SAMN05421803_1464 [Nocardiopsis flavescens]